MKKIIAGGLVLGLLVTGCVNIPVRREGVTSFQRNNRPRAEYKVTIYTNNLQVWTHYRTRKIHRQDGPAVYLPDGHEEWWRNGKRHRVGGPAVTWPNGDQEFWVNGKREDSIVANQIKTITLDGVTYVLVREE